MNELIKVNYDSEQPTVLGTMLLELTVITRHGSRECASTGLRKARTFFQFWKKVQAEEEVLTIRSQSRWQKKSA